MSTCYTVWLRDEFDWNYKNYSKDELRKDILKIVSHANFVADFNCWLVFEIDKTYPHDGKFNGISCDFMMISDDNTNAIPIRSN